MNTIFLPDADEELREAARYYENEASGVGVAFIAEVKSNYLTYSRPTEVDQKDPWENSPEGNESLCL